MLSAYQLPILSTIPRSGTWFLRYAISFLCHLQRGGRVEDRLTGRVVGEPTGPTFDFARFKGGPLFAVKDVLPAEHLFIGHTACPGFRPSEGRFAWWAKAAFHVPGYDYFHEGLNYRYTPVELAPYDYASVRQKALERAAARGRGAPIALVYRNPLDQAASYFRYGQEHRDPAYSQLENSPLIAVPFRDYLLRAALPSYAKQFVSFQALAEKFPNRVRLFPYERLMADRVAVLRDILTHLYGSARDWPFLDDAVWLARRANMKVIEKDLGRSLDGTRTGSGSHMRPTTARRPDSSLHDEPLQGEVVAILTSLGINTDLFEWTVAEPAAATAAA